MQSAVAVSPRSWDNGASGVGSERKDGRIVERRSQQRPPVYRRQHPITTTVSALCAQTTQEVASGASTTCHAVSSPVQTRIIRNRCSCSFVIYIRYLLFSFPRLRSFRPQPAGPLHVCHDAHSASLTLCVPRVPVPALQRDGRGKDLHAAGVLLAMSPHNACLLTAHILVCCILQKGSRGTTVTGPGRVVPVLVTRAPLFVFSSMFIYLYYFKHSSHVR